MPLCLMWCLWREQNARCFDGQELSRVKLKYSLLKSLSEWTSWSPLSSVMGVYGFPRVVELSLIICGNSPILSFSCI